MKAAVKDVMTRKVVVASTSTPFRDLANLMRQHRIGAIPVLDLTGRVVGIVSEADLVLKEERAELGSRHLFEGGGRRRERAKAEAVDASALMTSPAITVTPETSVAEAATLIHRHRVRHLPVVQADQKVVGIVSRSDLLKVFLRPEDEIRADVEHVLAARLGDTRPVKVDVENGLVRLSGSMPNQQERAAVRALLESVDGVISLEMREDGP